jgi:hypothetical protein
MGVRIVCSDISVFGDLAGKGEGEGEEEGERGKGICICKRNECR